MKKYEPVTPKPGDWIHYTSDGPPYSGQALVIRSSKLPLRPALTDEQVAAAMDRYAAGRSFTVHVERWWTVTRADVDGGTPLPDGVTRPGMYASTGSGSSWLLVARCEPDEQAEWDVPL